MSKEVNCSFMVPRKSANECSSFCTGFLVFLLCALYFPSISYGDEFTSSSFRVLQPIVAPASYGTSTGFQLWGMIGQIGVGTSSATGFTLNSGFLSFPYVSTPAVSATAGNAQVALSWSASEGFLGWTVSGYSVGQSTASGGPYSYTALSNVTSSTRTGLTNGATYYFVIVAKDAFGNFIATSTQVSAAPTAPVSSPPATSGGGGGGGGGASVPPSIVATGATFTGLAYPKDTLTLLKDAQVAATTIAGNDANFQMTLTGLTAGNYNFSIYGEDKDGRRSSLLTFPVGVSAGATTNVSGIFIAPTIAVDKSEVKRGDNIAIFGQSVPKADIIISVNSEDEFFAKTISDNSGIYLYNFDSTLLELGVHTARSKAAIGNQLISGFSYSANFKVGTKNIVAPVVKTVAPLSKGNLNNDSRVNLVDFSIMAYWYRRVAPPKHIDINSDGKVNLQDFSIMAYYWTG